MRLLIRQTVAFLVALLAALVLLGAVTSFTDTALARSHAVPAARFADFAGSLVLPAVLIALLVASLYAGARGASLAMAALALAALGGGREVLQRGPSGQPTQPAKAQLEALVAPREIQAMADPGVWLYAGEVGSASLRDVLVIAAAPSPGARADRSRLAYVAEARPGADLRVGAWRLSGQPVRFTLLAADEEIRSIAADVSALELRIRGASRGAALTLAGVLLAFAGTGVLVRSSRWPLLGWSIALLIGRGVLFALGPQGQSLAARTLGPAAADAPLAAVLAVAALLVAADLLGRGSRARPRGARRG